MFTRIITLTAVTALAISSTAMARGGGMAMHAGGSGMAMHGHGHFDHDHFDHRRFDHRFHFVRRFNRNLFLSGWGWGDWGLGGYGDYGNGGSTTIVTLPQAVPQVATGSSGPCHWNQETFTVPSSAGGTRPVQVVSCH